MKKIIFLLLILAVVLVAGVLPVYAHGGIRGGIWIGPVLGPWWGPVYRPYYYEPPIVVQQAPVYQYDQQTPQTQEPQYYWYFCPDAKAYYPYVKNCPGGWLKVVPTPPQ